MIILYDIDTLLPGRAFSPNTWKTRFTLNYKAIPYRTEWIEFADIPSVYNTLDIEPKNKTQYGLVYHSLPVIWDTATGAKISDSLDILEYLEATYPDRPTLFPHNTKALHLAFQDGILSSGFTAVFPFIIPDEVHVLSPRSAEYFVRTRLEHYKINVDEMTPTGGEAEEEWTKFKASLDTINRWYGQTDDVGTFLMGDVIGWGDIVAASWIIWIKIMWEKDPRWQEIASWNEGRWVKLLEAMELYTAIN